MSIHEERYAIAERNGWEYIPTPRNSNRSHLIRESYPVYYRVDAGCYFDASKYDPVTDTIK